MKLSTKVTQINKLYYPWIGGVESHVQQVAECLSARGIESEVLCCSEDKKPHQFIHKNVRIHKCSSWGIFLGMPISFSFILAMRKLRSDILHIHLPNPWALVAYFLARPTGLIIITWHSDVVRQKRLNTLFRPLEKWLLKRARTIFVTSPIMMESPSLQCVREKIAVVPLSIRVSDYQTAEDPTPTSGRFALFVGRLVPYKGIFFLLESLVDTPISLVVIGDGPLLESAIAFAKERLRPGQVTFLPPQEREALIGYYHACDFLVLPSVQESEAFGIVQLEAMACHKPVISTRLPTGVPYVNQHNQTGITVPVWDRFALKSALMTLWNDDRLRAQMGTAAYRRVEGFFDESKMMDAILRHYSS